MAISICFGVLWGFLTQRIIRDKGYDTNWFWWGFFFGLIALIVACTRPKVYRSQSTTSASSSNYYYKNPTPAAPVGWTCNCGKVNPNYVTTCSCGLNKQAAFERMNRKKREQEQQMRLKTEAESAAASAAALKSYKELLDSGVITQEEFDEKKKQLLNL